MQSAAEAIHVQRTSEAENEPLYLPSSFDAAQRENLSIADLAIEEGCLRSGQACDYIIQLRKTVKTLSALHSQRKKNAQHQKQQTRARARIKTLEFTRDSQLATYSSCRQALDSLGCLNDPLSQSRYPVLTAEDLNRKSTFRERGAGDSRHADGQLWTALASPADGVLSYDRSDNLVQHDPTQMNGEGLFTDSFLFQPPLTLL